MTHHLYKLIPPRPTFALDLTDDEAAIMGEHAAYWSGLVDAGHALAFGPVLDPSGSWGLALVEAPDEETVRRFGAADPAVTSGLARFDVFPMPMTVVRS